MLRKNVLVVVAVFASASIASATDIVVGPGQSIQAAIVQAVTLDRVLVQPGTYVETIDFLGKNIQVIGVGGAAVTILDGGGAPVTLVTFTKSEPFLAVLSDFTVRNASVGIFINNPSHPTLRRLIVEGHKILGQPLGGYGIRVTAYAKIEECIVRDNEEAGIAGNYYDVARSVISGNQHTGVVTPSSMRECLITENVGENGGGVSMYGGTLDRCVIKNNTATKNGGGIYSEAPGGAYIAGSEIAGNHAALEGGGIYARAYFTYDDDLYYPQIKIENCVIHGNTATSSAGMYAYAKKFFTSWPDGEVDVLRTTFTRNVPDAMTMIATHGLMTDCIVWDHANPFVPNFSAQYCDIQFGGTGGPHDIDANPLFVDSVGGDVHLTSLSPCIGKGSSTSERDFEGDSVGGVADMGGDEFAPHLYIPGLVKSGGPITINTIGTPGAPVLLFASLSRTDPGVATSYGFFALGFPLLPAFPVNLGSIPANSRVSISATVPPGVPVGTVIHMQAFVGGASPALTLPLTLLIN